MKRILKIGMDVHTTNYTLCAMEPVIGEEDRIFATIKVTPDYKNILMFNECPRGVFTHLLMKWTRRYKNERI